MPDTFSPAVVRFLAEHVRSLDELQLLMSIVQTPDRWWDADAVSREIGLSPSDARRALDHFAARNLLDIRITGDVRYRFQPGTQELRDAVTQTLAAYRARPLDTARLVAGSRRRSARDFADAFRLRRDDDDDIG